MKQEISSVDVAAIVRELKPRLLDAKITKIYQHSPEEIRIGLHIFKEGRTNLIIELDGDFTLQNTPRLRRNSRSHFPCCFGST